LLRAIDTGMTAARRDASNFEVCSRRSAAVVEGKPD
jgi:hypothetical protein